MERSEDLAQIRYAIRLLDLKANISLLTTSRLAHSAFFSAVLFAPIQLLLPLVLYNYGFAPIAFGTPEALHGAVAFCVIMFAMNLMGCGLVFRLLARPSQVPLVATAGRLLAANSWLIRRIPIGTRKMREREIVATNQTYVAEVYPGNWSRLALGYLLSTLLVCLFAMFSAALLVAIRAYSSFNVFL